MWLGILCNMFAVFTDIYASVAGAMLGYMSLWSIYILFKLVTGKEGMGHGDFKLLALLGAWMGWQSLPMIVILSSVCGAIVGSSMIVFKGHDRQTAIPFGPYLAMAGWIALIWGQQLINASHTAPALWGSFGDRLMVRTPVSGTGYRGSNPCPRAAAP